MNSIPGIEKLSMLLSSTEIEKLVKAAGRHSETSNMNFTILSVNEEGIEIEVTQGETKSGRYASETTLSTRTKDLFSKLLPKTKLRIYAQTFAPSPASTVTTAWLESKMQQKGVRIKQIAFDTGLDRESISDWVTGKRSMSQIVKAMFYFYLK
ncbi:XRE family transcriptional regulator [Pedobacter boryungensis]|uniref:XRE family transcriptional regulator n=1 Tax=Pedobacter boryungensis TaxID=869962 RepID=A0ABX2DB80_9SPHI|nr:XRE family transcriptional regulator [Pedobacter boryungensis]